MESSLIIDSSSCLYPENTTGRGKARVNSTMVLPGERRSVYEGFGVRHIRKP